MTEASWRWAAHSSSVKGLLLRLLPRLSHCCALEGRGQVFIWISNIRSLRRRIFPMKLKCKRRVVYWISRLQQSTVLIYNRYVQSFLWTMFVLISNKGTVINYGEGGGYKTGKLRVWNMLRPPPPQDRVKLSLPPTQLFLKGGNCLHPPLSVAKTLSAPPLSLE